MSTLPNTTKMLNRMNFFSKLDENTLQTLQQKLRFVTYPIGKELGREDVESGKSAIETVTEDVKKMAAVQSPTEFMQLQGELARRNFDAAVEFGSKRSEALVKLYNEAFAPLSNRVSLAAEKIKKAA